RAAVRAAVRYVKRAVYLPWNFQKVHENVNNLFEVARQQIESQWEFASCVRELRERQAILEQHTAETLRELTEEFRAAAREMHHEMRQVKNRYAEFYGLLAEGQREQTGLTAQLLRSVDGLRGTADGRADGSAPAPEADLPPPQILNLELYKTRLGR